MRWIINSSLNIETWQTPIHRYISNVSSPYKIGDVKKSSSGYRSIWWDRAKNAKSAKVRMDLSENELSEIIIGLCIEVHRELGPGLLESVYEEALAYELGITGLKFTRQENLPVYYKSIKLNIGFRTDIVVENKVLVEIKSVETMSAMHKKIALNYIKLRDLKLALLVNFNVILLKNGIVRLVNGLEEQ